MHKNRIKGNSFICSLAMGISPCNESFPARCGNDVVHVLSFYITHFNLFSILMTSQLVSSSLRMNVSMAKEQNMGKPS